MRTLFGLLIIAALIALVSCEKETPPPEGQYNLKFVVTGSCDKYSVFSFNCLVNSDSSLNDTIDKNTTLEFITNTDNLHDFVLKVHGLDDSNDAYVEIDCYKNGKFITKIIGTNPAWVCITSIYYE